MCREEYIAYRNGDVLHNDTDHYRDGKGGSISKGFCFFQGNTAQWARRLNGLVEFDVLLTVEVDPSLVKESFGVYADYLQDQFFPPKKLFREFCATRYDCKSFRFVHADHSFDSNPNYISRKNNPFFK